MVYQPEKNPWKNSEIVKAGLVEEVEVKWLIQFRNKFQDYLLNYYGKKEKTWRGRKFTMRKEVEPDLSFIVNLYKSVKNEGMKEPLVMILDRKNQPMLKYGGSRVVVLFSLGYEYAPLTMILDGNYVKPSTHFGESWKNLKSQS